MLRREKDTYTVFKQAIIRNLAFMRIHTGIQLIFDFINDSYSDYKPEMMKRIPETLIGTPTYEKVKECSDAVNFIQSLTDIDIPPIVDNIRILPFVDRLGDDIPPHYLDPEIISAFLPEIQEGLQLVKDTPIYQDILVAMVTAFEVYLRDTLQDLIVNNGEIARKFVGRVKAYNNVGEYLELNRSTRILIAHEITKHSSFYDVKKIQDLFETCFKKRDKERFQIYPEERRIQAVQYYLKLRHLLVHSGGIVDQQFLNATRDSCKYAFGEQHPVMEKHVDQLAELTKRIAKRIEEEIANY